MKRIFKILSLLLVSALIAISLSSCHGSRNYDYFDVPEELDTSKNYEITFWAKNDTNMAQVEVYKRAIDEFTEIYPNIKVNLVLYTDYGRIYQDVITNIQTGTTPNVCITYPDHIATYITGNDVVVPLDSLIADEKFGLGGSEVKFDAPSEEDMIPEFMEEGKIGGVQYALPFMRSTEVLYINETYVKKLGYDEIPEVVTWDWVFEVSKRAMEKGEDGKYLVNGQDIMIPFIYKSTDNMMIQMLKQKGAEYSNDDGEILIFNDDTKEILYTIADSASEKAFSTFKISSYPANFLNAGQCIFAVDSTAGATWMGKNAHNLDIDESTLIEYDMTLRVVPQYDVENPQMISQGPSVCIFNKEDSGEVLASWLFTQYLLTDGIQMGYATTEGYVPVTKRVIESDEYQDYLSRAGEDNEMYYDVKIGAAKLLLANTDKTFITPVFNGSASLRGAAGQMIEEVVKRINRKGTVDDEYIDELYSQMVSLYHLDEGELGPMPTGSVALIVGLLSIWLIIGSYLAVCLIKRKKNRDKY